ncbi:hypothetical protein GPECTOR_68g345 [Gonium pectorale]|uniref:S1 motif domain-containing protein n=1 Tax=Gonium pectorale TaxID=33097 RepID=A0A150G3H5_GONPE|nr:hypothetical protein GPECTOR_68g345 [Gonium pectorale]|eukprot:KXZ44374.1 hypothetical protein GPECTOR_68g345 [Gonium pectorale]
MQPFPPASTQPGDLVSGKVKFVGPSHAWVDLGTTLAGFLHVSRISSQHVASAADVLAEGDEVTAMVRRMEPGSRVVLATMQLEPQPGDMLREPKTVYARAEETLRLRREALPKVHDLVSGTVTSTSPSFGAFIDLGSGLTGLLPIGGVSASPVTDLSALVAVGDEIKAQVHDLVSGRVESIEPSMSIIDLGSGLSGLLKKHDVSASRVTNLGGLMAVGDEVKAQPGDLISGVVTSVGPSHAWVDLGTTLPGFLHVSRISSQHVASVSDVLAEGDEIQALVRRTEPGSRVMLSVLELEPKPGDMLRKPTTVYRRAKKTLGLRRDALPKPGALVTGVVISIRPSFGAFIDLGSGLTGLLAIGDVSGSPVTDLGELMAVGDEVKAQVHKVDTQVCQLGLSTKVLESEPGDMLRDPKAVYARSEEMLRLRREALPKVGDLVSGRVESISPSLGAFIDLGSGLTGLLRAQDVSASPVTDLRELMAVGDEVKAQVTRVYTGTCHVVLSTKVLEREPGDMLRDPKMVYERSEDIAESRRGGFEDLLAHIKVGTLVSGVVQSVQPYGAFIDLGNGARGLLHISQVSMERVKDLGAVFARGDEVKALVLTCDREEGRVTLSIKKLEPSPGDMLRDPRLVYATAEEMAEKWRQQLESAP